MSENISPVNMIQCTGRITYKNYEEDRKRLFFAVSMSIPRITRSDSDDSGYNRDFPGFIVEGEKAEELNETLNVRDRVTVIGHADTERSMVYQGQRMFKQEWTLRLIADNVMKDAGGPDSNSVTMCGEVIRVYKNADQGKRFYLITLKIPMEDGPDTRVSFAYFDRGMRLEPEVGDAVYATGSIQTKRLPVGNTDRTRLVTSIVSRSVAIERRKKEE